MTPLARVTLTETRASGSRPTFSTDQKWCKLPSNIEFVDQTLDTVRSVDVDSNFETHEDDADGQDSLTAQDSEYRVSDGGQPHNPTHAYPSSPLTTGLANTQQPSPLTHTTLPLHHSHHGLCELPPQISIEPSVGYTWGDGHLPHLDHLLPPHVRPYPEAPHTHAVERERAELFRYFIFNLSPAFDFGDPDKSFSKGLAQHALADHNLTDLIALVSARHLGSNASLMGREIVLDGSSRPAHNRDIARSLLKRDQLDMALLHRFGQIMEAAALNISNTGWTADLLGDTHQSPLPTETHRDFEEAICWASLRLEVYLAIFHQTSSIPTLHSSHLNKSLQSDDDRAWANQILLLLAEIIEYCFGNNRDDSRYDALLDDLTTWTHSKPDSFTPIYISQPSNGQLYPEIWVYNESVAAGLQHYHLARILLLSHNPTLPKIGSAKTIAKKKIDREIKNDSNIICGIAESISQVNPAHIIACMAIALVGDLFQQRNEQESLLHILTKTTKQYGWPTSSIQAYLREAWDWVS
ncbi:hypothetical protein BHE90_001990 [Fusarium euwallaceae]|uniref:ARCA protein n=1 Tax=Fusarium euwallaceae TaxID=1147111 RepID=A0A430M6B3_9HYPO|nr:hypothetical protein BHE90_001990 [Fusarium euwallaceae]